MLGVSVYMVRGLIRQGRLPYYRIGRRIVLDRRDLEQFLLAHRVEARAWPPVLRPGPARLRRRSPTAPAPSEPDL